MHLNNLTVSRKLWALIAGLMLTMLVLGGGLMAHLMQTQKAAAQALQGSQRQLELALRWKGLSALAVERSLLGVSVTDEALATRLRGQASEGIKAINALQQQLEAQATLQDKAQLERVAALRKPVLEYNTQAIALRTAGDYAAASDVVEQQLLPAVQRYVAEQDAFAQLQEEQGQSVVQAAVQQRQNALVLAALVALAVVALGVVLAGLLVRSITAPLLRAVSLADAISEGDLTQDVHDVRRDEMGQLLRSLSGMAARLRGVVGEVRSGVESVSSASSEIASGNLDLSSRTEQAAASLQQTAASMEELTSTVAQSVDTARQADQLAATAAQAAERGGQVVGEVVTSMQQITDSSRRIADIIGVIDGIAFQTNILALNAAVEAARAGEQGRGFAVVAGEVRSLAQRSAEAAKEIKQLITTSVDNVQTGSAQVEQAGRSMQDIVTSVRRVSDLIGEITAASSEQRDGISQVNQAVSSLDQMTQQNAALVEQSSAAATAMHEQAQRLAQVVAMFNVGAGVALAPAPAAARRPAAARAMAAPTRASTTARQGVSRRAGVQPERGAAARIAAPASAGALSPGPTAAPTTAGDEWESF